MIILEDSIEIKTTPEKIFNWFKNLDNESFTKWHPNHKKFVRVTGGMEEGDIVCNAIPPPISSAASACGTSSIAS